MAVQERIKPSDCVPASEAAEVLGWTKGYLQALRSKNEGPPCLKIGGRVFYPKSQLEVWIENNIRWVVPPVEDETHA